MNTRIKEIRKHAGLTQTDFGEKIGVKGNTITGYESGLRTPTNAIIKSICETFNVNETWLRTGEGEMLRQYTPDQSLMNWFGKIMRDEGQDPEDVEAKRLITLLSKLKPEHWKALSEIAELLYETQKEAHATPEDGEGRD